MVIFAPPLSTSRPTALERSSHTSSNKRKRGGLPQDREDDEGEEQHERSKPPKDNANLEHTVVISPLERSQRRVAGHPFDEAVPELPYPHAGIGEKQTSRATPSLKQAKDSKSLHLQHIAALTAIIHRSVLKRDFPRASRAMGLMFRENAIAWNASMRNRGYMGIAAEILLRHDEQKTFSNGPHPTAVQISQTGLENAKRFYEALVVRNPPHKSWPSSVNAIDFYLAIFNIWIYTVSAQARTKTSDDHSDSHRSSRESDELESQALAKMSELEHANEIANRMDECMTSVPYMDEPELLRLRAMVDLWLAELYEVCHAYTVPVQQVSDIYIYDHGDGVGQESREEQTDYIRLARKSREQARERLSKLEGQPTSPNDA